MTTLFVPKEIRAGERRVAASPESVKKLVKTAAAAKTWARDHFNAKAGQYATK